jgi:hypothetical protein
MVLGLDLNPRLHGGLQWPDRKQTLTGMSHQVGGQFSDRQHNFFARRLAETKGQSHAPRALLGTGAIENVGNRQLPGLQRLYWG